MKAIFDFIPHFCPNCGKPLLKPKEAAELEAHAVNLAAYHNGQPFTCGKCGLAFQKAVDPIKLFLTVRAIQTTARAIRNGERDTEQGLIDIIRDAEFIARLTASKPEAPQA